MDLLATCGHQSLQVSFYPARLHASMTELTLYDHRVPREAIAPLLEKVERAGNVGGVLLLSPSSRGF